MYTIPTKEAPPGASFVGILTTIMTFPVITFALFGLIIGSFLNVIILRLHTGQSSSGRSGCMSCGAQLSWTELVPVFSFFALRGRCKTCGSSISHQYWIVEVLTAVLFALIASQNFGLLISAFYVVVASLLVVIGAYDLRHTIIPNKLV